MTQLTCTSCGSINSEFNPTCAHCGAVIPLRSSPDGETFSEPCPQPDPEPTTYIDGRFRIIEVLGEGGMGRVYHAHDTQLDRDVALKVLHSHEAGPTVDNEHLVREARAASALNHPNIVTTYDLALDGETALIAMEYVRGRTLEAILAHGPLPATRVGRLSRQIVDAMKAAHRAGILHLDLQPANVMITEDDTVKILDFGLAAMRREASLHRSGAGTPRFMAPEQFLDGQVDERTDIFGSGMLIAIMLTGQNPFSQRREAGSWRGLTSDDATILQTFDPNWRDILERTLADDPTNRFRAMADLAEAIEGMDMTRDMATRDLPAMVTIAPPPSPLLPWLRRSRNGLAALLIAIMAVALFYLGQRSTAPDEITANRTDNGNRLVVLPFQLNGSKPIAHEYRDGIMVALIQRLTDDAKAADFPQIVPAAEIRRKKVEGIFQIRNRLDAELAVRGKLRVDVEGANLRLELIDVHRLSVLHAEIIAGRDMLELVEGAHQAIKGFLSPAQLAVAETGTSAIENQGSQNERQAYDAYLQGEGLLFRDDRKGNLGRAVSAFEQAVDLAPAQASYQAALARALLRRFHVLKQGRDLVAAREASQKALALNDQLALAWQTYGAVAFEEGSYEQAVEALERAQLLNPLAVANYLLLGRIYARIGDPRAEQAYQRACELQPDNWKSQLQLGNFHLRRGGYEKAEQAFQLVRGLVPDSSVGYQSLATVYQLQGRLELALQHYQRALEIRPGGAIALSNMGAIFMSLGRFEEAANAFQRSVNLNPRNPFSQGNLGDAFRFLEGEAAASEQAYQQAITLLREQIETNPNEPGSRIFLANYLAKAGRTETAVETLAQIEGLDRLAEVVPLYTIGQTYAIIGRRDRALEFIGKALAQGYPARELQHDPFMTEFRRDPAYDELVTPAR